MGYIPREEAIPYPQNLIGFFDGITFIVVKVMVFNGI